MSTQQKPSAAAPQTQALVQAATGPLAVVKWGMTGEQIELLKRTVARGTSDDEFALFMTVASRLGLDPFLRQIHAVKRPDGENGSTMTIQVGIDGYRLMALRTGEEDGQEGPWWCGGDGAWKDVWLSSDAPVAAKVAVHRKGRSRPYVAIALWASYVQTRKDGTPNAMWRKHGPGQLAKCAEALARRMAYPAELAGTHTDDELGTDSVDAEFTEVRPIPQTAPALVTQTPPPEAATPVGPPPGVPVQRPPLTEDEVIDAIERMTKAGTEPELRKIAAELGNRFKTDAQRDRLLAAHKAQLAEIRTAQANEAAAEAPAKDGQP